MYTFLFSFLLLISLKAYFKAELEHRTVRFIADGYNIYDNSNTQKVEGNEA